MQGPDSGKAPRGNSTGLRPSARCSRLGRVKAFAWSLAIHDAASRAGAGQYRRAPMDFQADAAAYPQLEALS